MISVTQHLKTDPDPYDFKMFIELSTGSDVTVWTTFALRLSSTVVDNFMSFKNYGMKGGVTL